MIRLANFHRHPFKKRIFYFHTMDECNEFLNVFKENSCNVNWTEPREIPDKTKIKNGDRELMEKSPADRANNALDWGFEMVNDPFSVFTS